MKNYCLKLSKSDLTDAESIGVFRSSLIDLYDNDSYRNYSTTKSTFGIDSLGNNIWTGMSEVSEGVTDSGFIETIEVAPSEFKSRFVDTSGRIDITGFEVFIKSQEGSGSVESTLSIFSSTISDGDFPEDFSSTENITNKNSFYVDVDRYTIFEVTLNSDENLDTIDFDFYLTVAISAPIMAPFYDSTRRIAYKFPEWTDFNVDSALSPDSDAATPSWLYTDRLATPNYLGTSITNAIAGQWIDELEFLIKKYGFEQYISTADVDQKYLAYETDTSSFKYLVSVYGDGFQVPRMPSMFEFYQLSTDEDGFFFDTASKKIYSNLEYEELAINDEVLTQKQTAIWNWFDEFGMTVDLYRIEGEDNTRFKQRILDVYRNKPGVTIRKFKNAIRRELDLWYEFGSTPNSNMGGATPEILEISELENVVDGATPYMNYDGLPTKRFEELADTLIDQFPILWGHFKYDHAFWDQTGNDNSAIKYLPHRYDATPVYEPLVYTADIPAINEPHAQFKEWFNVDGDIGSFGSTFPSGWWNPYIAAPFLNAPGSIGGGVLIPDATDGLTMIKDVLGSDQPITSGDNEYIQWGFLKLGDAEVGGSIRFDFWSKAGALANLPDEMSDQASLSVYQDGPDWNIAFVVPSQLINSVFFTGTYNEVKDFVHSGFLASIALSPSQSIMLGWVSADGSNTVLASTGFSTSMTHVRGPLLNVSSGSGLTIGDWFWGWSENADATPASLSPVQAPKYYQPGIGDGDDLFAYKPGSIVGPVDFTADIEVRGKRKIPREEHPLLTLNVDVRGVADRVVYDDEAAETECFLQFVIMSDDATPVPVTHTYNFSLTSQSDIFFEQATPSYNSIVSPNRIGGSGLFEIGEVIFNNVGEEITITPQNQDLFNLVSNLAPSTDITFGIGYYDAGLFDIVDVVPSEDLRLGWLDQDVSALTSGTYTITRSSDDGFYLPVLANYEKTSAVDLWKSPPTPHTITLNGVAPLESVLDYELVFDDIVWPANLEDPPNKYWEITVTSLDGFYGNPAAWYLSSDSTFEYLSIDKILVDGDGTWTAGVKTVPYGTESVTFSSTTSASPEYPETQAPTWEFFSETITDAISSVVDERTVWRNGAKPHRGLKSTLVDALSLTRDDFSLSNSSDFVITWIGVSSNNPLVDVWLDTNTVRSVANTSDSAVDYGNSYIEELYNSGGSFYYMENVIVRARLKTTPDPHWYPQVHSGYANIGGYERYLYVDPAVEYVTGATANIILDDVVRQGAPVIVKTDGATPEYFRHTAFHDATPELRLTNEETINGSGTFGLYAAYKDIYDITVINLTDNETVDILSSSTETNFIETVNKTDRAKEYLVTYIVNNSFYVDSTKLYDGILKSKVVFDKTPEDLGAGSIEVIYETSKYYPATPVDVALNPFYTTVNEGFIYVTTTEYGLETVEIRMSPGKLIADAEEFYLLTVKAYDTYGNPKEGIYTTIWTDFGTIADSELTTDADGFAATILTSSDEAPVDFLAHIHFEGQINEVVELTVAPQKAEDYSVAALPTLDSVQADGQSYVSVVGVVRKPNSLPASYSVIRYRKGRTIYDVFNQTYSTEVIPEQITPIWADTGLVIADEYGRFEVGPFDSATPGDPGYWFVAVETQGATPIGVPGATPGTDTYESHAMVGDVVYWFEYPEVMYGTEQISGQPKLPANVLSTSNAMPIAATPAFPSVYYQDTDPIPSGAASNWEPPTWYAINKYDQYQYGILGSEPNLIDYSGLDNFHPDYKEF